jgi:prophage antirepressor-like protein
MIAFQTSLLDTLAQLGTNLKTEPKDIGFLAKRARAKTFTAPLSVKLASLDSDLKKSYWNSYYCNESLTQEGNKITGKYCNNRWCSVCNRIRTAKLIQGYNVPLSELEDKQFVTLTLPNCAGEKLRETIDFMLKSCKDVQEVFKKRHLRGKQDWQLVGIRKLECTFNHRTSTYHPHFHFLVEGEIAGKELVNEWLKRVPTASRQAQDVRKADVGAETELFKYFSKIVTKTEKGFTTFVEPLDVIFTAMRGLRVFQPIGLKKDVLEDIEDIISEEISGIEDRFVNWKWYKNDWVDKNTGEVLTGYIPSDSMNRLIDNIITRPTNMDVFTTLQKDKTMENQLTPFEGEKIRKTWHNEEWHFVIEDIISSLTASSNPKGYIKDMRRRDPILSKGWGQIAHTLSVDTMGGKQRMNCANTEGVFRIIMSVPSLKAEPLKLWLASLGKQAIDEAENPELLSERQAELYKAKGYSDEWVKRRMQTIETRKELTDEWKQRGVKEHQEYAILTATIAKGTFGLTPSEHKDLKGLDRQNLRDHMTPLELIFTALSEELTRGKAVELDAQGFTENYEAAEIGGKLTGEFVARVESTGRKVVSDVNYLGAKGGDEPDSLLSDV